jgi:CRP-like cAMP-binding protein
VHGAFIGLGVLFGVLLLTTRRQLGSADTFADVPVVAMSLLRRVPEFAPMPPVALEAVAREAAELQVEAGDIIIREGARGDLFFAVADGRFDVTIGGAYVRTLDRGDGFGEIALLADVPRTATLTARDDGLLLAIQREAFLVAVTSHELSRTAAWRAIRSLELTAELRESIPGPD